MKKTKFLISGVGLNLLQDSGEFPCAICRSGVGVNSIECSQCKLWVHKKCSGLTGRLVADPNSFVKGVEVLLVQLMVDLLPMWMWMAPNSTWKPPSAIWATCFQLVVVAITLLLLDVVRFTISLLKFQHASITQIIKSISEKCHLLNNELDSPADNMVMLLSASGGRTSTSALLCL